MRYPRPWVDRIAGKTTPCYLPLKKLWSKVRNELSLFILRHKIIFAETGAKIFGGSVLPGGKISTPNLNNGRSSRMIW
jgi:hypothetical protein